MIKLLDSFQAGDAFVCTLFADTKAEVPETAEGIEELVGDVCAPISAGTLIITSAFETAFVRSDGLIQWKGDPAPVPVVPVTVTLDATAPDGNLVAQYIDENGEIATANVHNGDTQGITVNSNSTIVVYSYMDVGRGDISTNADNVKVGEDDNGAGMYLVKIENDTTIAYTSPY